jgi:hypothetical protein
MNEDINSYLINDLLKMFSINDNYNKLTKNEFIKTANKLIQKTKNHDPELELFLIQAKNRILNEFEIIIKNENISKFDQEIISDTINPKYELFTSRILCVDSAYRNDLYSNKLNTDFTITLSETIKNVISLKLYSIQIPKTWYNIDSEIGNNAFIVDSSLIEIENGNYTIQELLETINTKLQTKNIDISFNYHSNNKKITIINNTSSTPYTIKFYDENIINSKCGTPANTNFNLGWNLGFREPVDSDNIQKVILNADSFKTGQAIASLYNPKYCLLVVDDFNKNHVNKGLISSVKNQEKLPIPSYNTKSCIKDENSNDILYIASNPRKLTQAQLYSINTIIENRKSVNNTTVAPTNSNVLALIPINNNSQEEHIIQYGTDLVENTRNYFGPVDIEKINVKLLNEKGKLINLNGVDWSFTIHLKQLYKHNF